MSHGAFGTVFAVSLFEKGAHLADWHVLKLAITALFALPEQEKGAGQLFRSSGFAVVQKLTLAAVGTCALRKERARLLRLGHGQRGRAAVVCTVDVAHSMVIETQSTFRTVSGNKKLALLLFHKDNPQQNTEFGK